MVPTHPVRTYEAQRHTNGFGIYRLFIHPAGLGFGAQSGSRTHKITILSRTPMPVRLFGQMVLIQHKIV